jgi:hypothetical protein
MAISNCQYSTTSEKLFESSVSNLFLKLDTYKSNI